jgi:hypothetical protein
MLPLMTTVSLPQVYCGWCHLSTRSDVARCLHCSKLLKAPPVVSSRSGRRPAKHSPIRGAGKRASNR